MNFSWEFIALWGSALGLSYFNSNYFSLAMVISWLGSFAASSLINNDLCKFFSHLFLLAANMTMTHQVMSYLYSFIFYFGFIQTAVSFIIVILMALSGVFTIMKIGFNDVLSKSFIGNMVLSFCGFITLILLNLFDRFRWILAKIGLALIFVVSHLKENLMLHHSNSSDNVYSSKVKSTIKGWGSAIGMKIFQMALMQQLGGQKLDKIIMPDFSRLMNQPPVRNFQQSNIVIDDNEDLDDLGTVTKTEEVKPEAKSKAKPELVSVDKRALLRKKLAEKRAERSGRKTDPNDLLKMNPDDLMKMVSSGQRIAVDKKQMKQLNRTLASMLQDQMPNPEGPD